MLNNGLIKIRKEVYLNLMIIVLPLLNFLVGINIDLYTPSLPAIAHYYNVPTTLVKSTITATLLGFAIGCLIFGTLIDTYGRRCTLLLAFTVYIITNLLTLACHSIEQLIILRFIQGLMASTFSIGSRALIVDNFTGHRLTIALMYTSITYSLGPIVAPFIGGILQYHFSWKANFLAYALFAMIIAVIFVLYVNESLLKRQAFSLKNTFSNYLMILKNKPFLAGIILVGGVNLEQMIYPTLGSFIVENKLHKTPIIYGNTALLVGAGYLCGTLLNRVFIRKFSLVQLISFGFSLLILGLLLQICFALVAPFNLFTLVLPFLFIILGTGFLFANVLGHCIKMFPNNVGSAIAILTCLLSATAAGGIFIISQISIHNLADLAIIFATIIGIQLLVFYTIFKSAIKNTVEIKYIK